ncbi:uncharacterized protein LOC125811643 isoform X1 [Solanum verrucosum]|uniref:uncharacterized protein LOC125811643 isoform X1 n=1 Tax=Solanum verrucosum TaxID=315347 RepID=UPI0020D184EB|nr:uncharacterized protein LOC125811643 isoform X1 [Solanum verrucosum]
MFFQDNQPQVDYFLNINLVIILAIFAKRVKMEDHGETKLTGIRQIVRLKQLLHKWQNVTFTPTTTKGKTHSLKIGCTKSSINNRKNETYRGGISPSISKRLRSSNMYWDSDEDTCQSPESPHGVPKGYLAVYVGPELRRFIIPTSYLSDSLFKKLLEKVEEEFGFDHSGGLTIPCEIETFKFLLQCMENHQRCLPVDSHHNGSDAGIMA